MDDDLHIHHRNLPHWELAGSTYFITFRLREGTLSPVERAIVFRHILSGSAKFYALHAAVVMPDHVHLILEPTPGVGLSRIMKGIKGVSAKLVNQARGVSGTLWQDESFDRILRDKDEYVEKWNYIHNNPVKSLLVEKAELYPYLFLKE